MLVLYFFFQEQRYRLEMAERRHNTFFDRLLRQSSEVAVTTVEAEAASSDSEDKPLCDNKRANGIAKVSQWVGFLGQE